MSAVSSRQDSHAGDHITEITVRIDMNRHGAWEVDASDERERVVCPTLADAKRRAQTVARGRPSELLVYDAYHRLLEHERLGIACRYRA